MTADTATPVAPAGPLGILAGGGALPEQIAEIARAQGRGVQIVAIEGEAGRGIERFPHAWVNWGGIGGMVTAFRNAGCRDVIFIGNVTRPDWRKVRPDLGLVKAIPTIIRLFGGGDDHVLRRVVRFFEAQGFTVRGVADVAPGLLVTTASLGRIAPAPSYQGDAARGFALIDALGFADVGQAVVVCGGKALAIEAAEGTDRMLARLAESGDRRAAGGVLVKGPKPGQELRIDMPAIGPRTVELAAKAGLAGIAVRAGRVLTIDRERLIEAADVSGLFVAGIEAPEHQAAARAVLPFSLLNRRVPDKHLRRDMARAANVLSAAAAYSEAAGVVVVRRHVIAIETGEGFDDMFARVTSLRQWGATSRSKRRGALAIGGSRLDDGSLEAVVKAAAAAGLAGIVLPPACGSAVSDIVHGVAEDAGLSLIETLTSGPERVP